MRSELYLSDVAGNVNHFSSNVLELYGEMRRISQNRYNETYSVDVVSDNGRLTCYRFKMWSPNILRFLSQMSAHHRYILATVLEAECKQKGIDQFVFYSHKSERPVRIKREMSNGTVTFTLSLASRD